MIYNIDIKHLWFSNFSKIDSPDGFQPINRIVKKENKKCYAILFSNGDIIECSSDHMIQLIGGEWIKSEDLKINEQVLARDTNTYVLDKLEIGIHDVYDLEVGHENHRYYSENISSHNTGKSSTVNAILRDLGGEALFINASLENSIDVLRGKITSFVSTQSMDDKIKVVVMDEFDNFSSAGMMSFRGFLDEFSDTCRFLFTGNYKEKIIPQLLQRMESYDYDSFNKADVVKQILERLIFILENEGKEYKKEDLIPVINTFYPSVRAMVGALQKYSVSGTLVIPSGELDNSGKFEKTMEVIKLKKFNDMIEVVNQISAPSSFYPWLYKNIHKFYEKANLPKVILALAKYQDMDGRAVDKNLNLAACCTEIMMGAEAK